MGTGGPLAKAWRRTRVERAIRAALAAVMLGWAALAMAQDAAPREVRLEIFAGADWAPTGIEIEAGDSLAIEAEPARAPSATISPDGTTLSSTRLVNALTEGLPAPDLPYAALIGRIGDGPVFRVGARYEAKPTTAGPLHLRWNLDRVPEAETPIFFPVSVRHTPVVPPDGDVDIANESTPNLSPAEENVASDTIAMPPPVPPPGRKPGAVRAPSVGDDSSSGGPWFALAFAALLLAAAAAGLTVRRVNRARTIKRTQALLGVSPKLDLGEGACRGGDLAAEGPAATLRARLEPGAVRIAEGAEDG